MNLSANQFLRRVFGLVASLWLLTGPLSTLQAGETNAYSLRPSVQVDGEGVTLSQLIQSDLPVTDLRLADAPAFGKTSVLTRAQISEALRSAGAELAITNWTGAETVRISRRSRALAESETLELLTATLQQQYVKDKGELELRVSRPWTTVTVPDEPFTLKILDLPTAGVTPVFITRFEVQTARGERVGSWQAAVQARVWRQIWVARSSLKRGELVREADVTRERRDVLTCRDNLADFQADDPTLELAEPVSAGAPLWARSVKPRAVIHRGQNVAATVQDGALVITLKVEALEDGAPGQLIRVRNPFTRRDLRGKVLDEQTILVAL